MAITDTTSRDLPIAGIADRWAVLRQFVIFCTVGAVSTAVNIGLGNLFLWMGFPTVLAHVCAFTIAVSNGFVLNRAWTFRAAHHGGSMRSQYAKFVAVNIVGLLLSLVIMLAVRHWLLDQQIAHRLAAILHERAGREFDVTRLAYTLGELTATPFVAVWNFTANKRWTFGGPSASGEGIGH